MSLELGRRASGGSQGSTTGVPGGVNLWEGKMARLVVNREEADLVTHELTRDIVTIGRVPLNQIVLDHSTVSAQHAMLLRVGDSYWLKDLNSTNGTQINNLLVTDAMLKDGDKIRFGSVIAVFEGRCRKGWSTWRIREILGEYFGLS
jgi:pSer/pThr/pTyr-binding forkhead associated (FHA) protein